MSDAAEGVEVLERDVRVSVQILDASQWHRTNNQSTPIAQPSADVKVSVCFHRGNLALRTESR